MEIVVSESDRTADSEAWQELGMSRLEEEWDNPDDAIYDNWKNLNQS